MYCYKCGCELDSSDHCPNCGADVGTYKKIIYTSNYLYNDGLEKAKVRDLSGAILSLKNSLWYNKDNLDARNLLGLIYYEIGETVAALSEWVISKNINDERLHLKKNLGADYLTQVQTDKQTMENVESSISRYNHALECCYTDNLDVAILQLKKVLQVNSHYLRARQLLALLYIEGEQYKKAYRELQKCMRLDVGNTTTLRYLQEVEPHLNLSAENGTQHAVRTVKTESGSQESSGKRKKDKARKGDVISYTEGNETIIQPVNAHNPSVDGFRIPSWIYGGVIGFIVGAALVAFLVLPARIQSIRTQAQEEIVAISEESNSKDSEISDLENEIADLEQAQVDLQEELALALESDEDSENKIDTLMSSAAYYIEDSVDLTNATAKMEEILPSTAEDDMSSAFIQLYEQLYPLLRTEILQTHADAGILAYEEEDPDYEYVIEELTFANEFEDSEEYGDTWEQRQYYLADSYYQLYLADPDSEEVVEWIEAANEVIANLTSVSPDSEYTELATQLQETFPDVEDLEEMLEEMLAEEEAEQEDEDGEDEDEEQEEEEMAEEDEEGVTYEEVTEEEESTEEEE